ncbi:MAG TPA: hypothetical protein VFG72_01130 [Marmoricola sp.]|nr:hypothetical protein [Marmoricola sp.]
MPLTYVGLHDTGFNDDGFVVLRDNGGRPARSMIPFEDLGHGPQLLCEHGVPAVPHLLEVLNLTALTKDVLPLHASAFTLDGKGVLVTGWSKGGKTEALLAAASRGAHYVGDEWIFLTSRGTMWGLPERIRLWAWHLDQLPDVRCARPRRDRNRMRAWHSLAVAARVAANSGTPGADMARKAAPVLQRQAYIQVPPAGVVGEAKVDLSGNLDAVVLVLSSSSDDITIAPAGTSEVSRRMAMSLAEERSALLAHYRQSLFAFPDRRCELLERVGTIEAELLSNLFDGRPAMKVTHPYPCDLVALGDAVLGAADELASRSTAPASQDRG